MAQKDAEVAIPRALLGTNSDIISALSAQIVDITARIQISDLQIEKLRAELAKFKRLTFGTSSVQAFCLGFLIVISFAAKETTRIASAPLVSNPGSASIINHCCEAWNKLINHPWRIMTIG